MTPNYSLYAIPVYWILSIVPNIFAIQTIRSATGGRYNNANPRSSSYFQDLQKQLPKASYSQFERAKAAHNNSLEGFPIFAAALIAGTIAGRPGDRLNAAAAAMLVLRALYIACYIGITSVKLSYVRSLVWTAGLAVAIATLIQAAGTISLKSS